MNKRKGNVYRYKNSYYIIIDKFRYLELKADNQNLRLKEITERLNESKLKYFSDKFLGIVLYSLDDVYKSQVKEYKRVYV